jgi:hypothetical protein
MMDNEKSPIEMVRIIISGAILFLFLSGCNLPRVTPVADQDAIATQVEILLTNIPTATTTTHLIPDDRTLFPSTPTPSPVVTSPPTSTPYIEPTSSVTINVPTSFDPRSSIGLPSWSDSLESGRNFFITEDPGRFKSEPEDGSFVLTSYKPDGWHNWSLSYPRLNNFVIETIATPEVCSGLDRYGLIIRVPDPTQGYLFGISCDGRYSFRRWDGVSFTNLIGWTEHSSINQGPHLANRFAVMADGAQFSMFINGDLVGTVEDNAYPAGTFGFFSASSETVDFRVRFEEISYWVLP